MEMPNQRMNMLLTPVLRSRFCQETSLSTLIRARKAVDVDRRRVSNKHRYFWLYDHPHEQSFESLWGRLEDL